jgi:hypothetical protein
MTTHRTKLLIWFTALTLILACVPPLATPVPTLDANAINELIMQTANAASTQTKAAMPTSTPTTTITPTPRNTLTPEPTLTPIQTFILPSPIPAFSNSKFPFYRVKHDSQLAVYGFKSRTSGGPTDQAGLQTPETVAMFVGAKSSSGTLRTRVDGSWETFINALNDHQPGKLNYLKADNSALFNTSGFPQLESLTMGGNIVQLVEIRGEWGRVHTLGVGQNLDPGEVNYFTRPDLVHKFVVVGWDRSTKTTYWTNPPKGDIYWPLVTSGPVWIPLNRLEIFPILPEVVTANMTLSIRTKPDMDADPTRLELPAGQPKTIIEYHPSGSDVWGRLESGGWIPLLFYEKGKLQYPTSWRMETLPPPP